MDLHALAILKIFLAYPIIESMPCVAGALSSSASTCCGAFFSHSSGFTAQPLPVPNCGRDVYIYNDSQSIMALDLWFREHDVFMLPENSRVQPVL